MIHAPTLLLIDTQPEYYTKSVQKAFPNFIEQITKLLAIARKHKFRIIHIREKYDMTKNKHILILTKKKKFYQVANTLSANEHAVSNDRFRKSTTVCTCTATRTGRD